MTKSICKHNSITKCCTEYRFLKQILFELKSQSTFRLDTSEDAENNQFAKSTFNWSDENPYVIDRKSLRCFELITMSAGQRQHIRGIDFSLKLSQ